MIRNTAEQGEIAEMDGNKNEQNCKEMKVSKKSGINENGRKMLKRGYLNLQMRHFKSRLLNID